MSGRKAQLAKHESKLAHAVKNAAKAFNKSGFRGFRNKGKVAGAAPYPKKRKQFKERQKKVNAQDTGGGFSVSSKSVPINRGFKIKRHARFHKVVHADTEFVQVLNSASTAFQNVSSIVIQAANNLLFPKLSAIAVVYEKYRVDYMRFHFIPNNSAASTGSFMAYVDNDPNDLAATGEAQVLANEDGVKTPVWESVSLSFNKKTQTNKWYYTRPSGTLLDSAEDRQDSPGQLHLFCDGVAAGKFGCLMVDYRISFCNPISPIPTSANANLVHSNTSVVALGIYGMYFDSEIFKGVSPSGFYPAGNASSPTVLYSNTNNYSFNVGDRYDSTVLLRGTMRVILEFTAAATGNRYGVGISRMPNAATSGNLQTELANSGVLGAVTTWDSGAVSFAIELDPALPNIAPYFYCQTELVDVGVSVVNTSYFSCVFYHETPAEKSKRSSTLSRSDGPLISYALPSQWSLLEDDWKEYDGQVGVKSIESSKFLDPVVSRVEVSEMEQRMKQIEYELDFIRNARKAVSSTSSSSSSSSSTKSLTSFDRLSLDSFTQIPSAAVSSRQK